MKIYLISPKYDIPSYFGSDIFNDIGLFEATWIADLCLPTVASLLPQELDIELCDETLTPIDFDKNAVIFVTGKIDQVNRMKEIGKKFIAKGCIVVMGGAVASLNSNLIRESCDILVKGEFENVAHQLIEDLENGVYKEEYIGSWTKFEDSKIPRWDLYPCNQALIGSIQTSRGCKYSCDFCQVSLYAGQPRHKRIDKVIEELEVLYKNGFRHVFICDDNFTANEEHTTKLLKKMIKWNTKEEPMVFLTQVSLDVADNTELLKLCSDAGIVSMFVGIETNNTQNLIDVHKMQNVGLNMNTQIEKFLKAGIIVMSGIVFGFDNDTVEGAFRLQQYLQHLPIPIYTVWALVAPEGTRLHKRLLAECRIEDRQVMTAPWDSNVIPNYMSVSEFRQATKELIKNLYDGEKFVERLNQTADIFEPNLKFQNIKNKELAQDAVVAVLRHLRKLDRKVYNGLLSIVSKKAHMTPHLLAIMMLYIQTDYMIYNLKD